MATRKPAPAKPRSKPASSKPAPKGRAPALPDPRQWFHLSKDFPFPVQIGAVFKDEKTGKVAGVGVYIRIPVPWEEYLTPWPMPEESEQ